LHYKYRMRLLAALLVVSVSFIVVTRVAAAGFPEVRWEGADGCPDEAAVRKTIALWLAQSVDAVDPRAIEVDARVKAQENGYLLELSLESPSGSTSERLTANSCATLVDAVALHVALAATDPATRLELAEPKNNRTSSKVGIGARLDGGAAVEQLPGFAFTATLVGSLELSMWRAEVGLGYVGPRATYYPGLPDIGVELQLLYGTGRLCARWKLSAAEIPVCFGIELGLMRGEGQGVEDKYVSDQLWGALVLGPALRGRLGSGFWAWMEVNALIALFRPGFQIRNLGPLYRPEVAAARALLGIERQFY
jgi:hypothetical protein